MLISIQKNLAFLAMTKTGSTAIEKELAPHCDIVFSGDPRIKHIQLRRFDRFIRPYLAKVGIKELETVCLFREPVDWLGSWYRYRSRPKLDGHVNSTKGLTFEQFVLEYMSETPAPFAQVGRQSRFVQTKNKTIGVDRIFRYEDFQEVEDFFSQRFSTELNFQRLNTSPKAELTLSDHVTRQIHDYLADDYDIFETLKSPD